MFGWFKKAPKEPSMGDVMDWYGELMEKYPLAIMDISMLPLPKTKMKQLLKVAYGQTTDPKMLNAIEMSFMFLSRFHDGVGSVPIDAILDHSPVMTRATIQADADKLAKHLPWEEISLADSEILMAEWKRFKAGEPI
jgi:hypothetical protein